LLCTTIFWVVTSFIISATSFSPKRTLSVIRKTNKQQSRHYTIDLLNYFSPLQKIVARAPAIHL
jgi:hypothetical protein